ncbi:hypothetical protein CSC94_07920 [Zhengella mangrovi]|uniref:Uncharacterized protein n=1 Tax=Zhengella mangrovi TaxID=1982044 RepID=A0A2G1QPZ0_9HYPH|nr:hypothetical protein CSC94_07920 [Zhengella mangrovi]
MFFPIVAAMQQRIFLSGVVKQLDSDWSNKQEDIAMGLTRSLNALVFFAAFAFIGLLVIGVVP